MARVTLAFLFLLLIEAGWNLEEKDMKEKEKEVSKLNNFVKEVQTVIQDMEDDVKDVSKEIELKKVKDASSGDVRLLYGKCAKTITLQQCREAARSGGGSFYHVDRGYSGYPYGCFEWRGRGIYYYNRRTTSQQTCSRIARCVCQADECGWTLSTDGKGGGETETDRYATGHNDCARMCKEMKKNNDQINGATYAPSSKRCWCEIRMKSRKTSYSYKSCFLTDKRGINYGDDGCRENDRCDEGNGDCDKDTECAPGLLCGIDNCAWGTWGDVTSDCCYKPYCKKAAKGTCCTKEVPCDRGEGYCRNDEDCADPWKCTPGSNICGGINYGGSGCTEGDPCAPGNGDCDFDSQCEGSDTICGYNNCVWGGSDDCCHKRRCHQADAGKCCSKENKCDRNEGKCDADDQCLDDLKCIGKTCRLKCDGENSCCNDGKCGVKEGDCDRDSHCKGDLKCGDRNSCRWGDGDACCYDPDLGQWYY